MWLKKRGTVLLVGLKTKQKNKKSPFPSPTFLSTLFLFFCLSLSLLTFHPLIHSSYLPLLYIPLTHSISMCTWEKEIALNCTYRDVNRAPLISPTIESLPVTNRTGLGQAVVINFNSKYVSPGARGPRLFSVIINCAKVYSSGMHSPVRFVKWPTLILRTKEESVSQEVIQLFVSLCSIHGEQKSITSRQK